MKRVAANLLAALITSTLIFTACASGSAGQPSDISDLPGDAGSADESQKEDDIFTAPSSVVSQTETPLPDQDKGFHILRVVDEYVIGSDNTLYHLSIDVKTDATELESVIDDVRDVRLYPWSVHASNSCDVITNTGDMYRLFEGVPELTVTGAQDVARLVGYNLVIKTDGSLWHYTFPENSGAGQAVAADQLIWHHLMDDVIDAGNTYDQSYCVVLTEDHSLYEMHWEYQDNELLVSIPQKIASDVIFLDVLPVSLYSSGTIGYITKEQALWEIPLEFRGVMQNDGTSLYEPQLIANNVISAHYQKDQKVFASLSCILLYETQNGNWYFRNGEGIVTQDQEIGQANLASFILSDPILQDEEYIYHYQLVIGIDENNQLWTKVLNKQVTSVMI